MIPNKQIPIKQNLSSKDTLAVNSIFYTLQGEGPFAGTPCVFLRLRGCNLQCPSCDTEYTSGSDMDIWDIVAVIKEQWPHSMYGRPLVVITGGEPFRQDISDLVAGLIEQDFKVQIETNGTLFVQLGWSFASPHLTVVCSPKSGKVNHQLLPFIKAYKYVLNADSVDQCDGLPILALSHSAYPRVARPHDGFNGDVYVQPIDVQDEEENKRHLNAAVTSSLLHGYRLCLQVHKLIGVA